MGIVTWLFFKKKINNIVLSNNNYSNNYLIQKNFIDYDYVELVLLNLIKKKIKVGINNSVLSLDPNNLRILKINKTNLINIKSNGFKLRPLAFCYKNGFFDVLHC